MASINWEYYGSLKTDITEQATFERVCKLAEGKLNAFTHFRAKRFLDAYDETSATDFENQVHAQIQQTMCELVSAMYLMESNGMGTGVTSVSNDGYSESYKVTTVAEREEQLLSIVRNGLSGTGLAGVL